MQQLDRGLWRWVPASLLVAILGCGGQTPTTTSTSSTTTSPAGASASTEGSLLILCGSSFRPPMERLQELLEEEIGLNTEFSFGGSEDLLPHVKLNAMGHVFVTHDPFMQYTEEANAMSRWVHVGYVAPVLVVQKGNPKKLEKFEDLANPGLKVILPNPQFSTCGEMVFQLLEKKGIKDAVMTNVENRQFKTHSEIGNQMKLGYGDAAMMWNGVANEFQDAVDVVPCPYEYDEEIRVGVIGLSYGEKAEQTEQLLDFVEAQGQQVFKEFGYVK